MFGFDKRLLSMAFPISPVAPIKSTFLSFFEKVYRLWEEKINNFRLQYGYFLINPNDDFFKSYKKLRKYMKKEMEC